MWSIKKVMWGHTGLEHVVYGCNVRTEGSLGGTVYEDLAGLETSLKAGVVSHHCHSQFDKDSAGSTG